MLRPARDRRARRTTRLSVLRLVPERPRRPCRQVRQKDLLGSTVTVPDSIFDRSRMSLIRLSRSVPAPWMVRANSTCLRREVALRVVAELLAEDQNAVERRAQLVRHVREELGLVLRGQGQLGGLLFQRAPRLLDFLVLAFDFGVLFGELLRLLLQAARWSAAVPSAGSAARRRAAATASAGLRSASSPRCVLSTMPMLGGELLEERQDAGR